MSLELYIIPLFPAGGRQGNLLNGDGKEREFNRTAFAVKSHFLEKCMAATLDNTPSVWMALRFPIFYGKTSGYDFCTFTAAYYCNFTLIPKWIQVIASLTDFL